MWSIALYFRTAGFDWSREWNCFCKHYLLNCILPSLTSHWLKWSIKLHYFYHYHYYYYYYYYQTQEQLDLNVYNLRWVADTPLCGGISLFFFFFFFSFVKFLWLFLSLIFLIPFPFLHHSFLPLIFYKLLHFDQKSALCTLMRLLGLIFILRDGQ